MRQLLLILVSILSMTALLASDIVTMPTANQLKKGEVDVAAYYLMLDMPSGAPQFVNYQTMYMGITDRFEIDVHQAEVDKDKDSTVLVASYKLLSETASTPDVLVGVRNFTCVRTTNNPAVSEKSNDPSYYLSAAKTFFIKPDAPGPPLVRAHVSVGTADYTLLGEKRHDGVFGGLQFLLHPSVGAVVEYDGADLITGVTIMPKDTGLTIKAGTYGSHSWVGLSYQKTWF